MSIDRPKILTAITVPSGGWQTRVQVSVAGQYDTNVDFTISAIDYFMSWDNQADDFLREYSNRLTAAIDAAIGGTIANHVCVCSLDSNGKVVITFYGSDFTGATKQDVKIQWTDTDGASIAAVMGFDGSADLALTGSDEPTATADWLPAYVWQADDDGWLQEMLIEDRNEADVRQAQALPGQVTTQHIATRYSNVFRMNFITSARTFSDGVGYTEAPTAPYLRNKGLECWWMSAQQGVRFRFYRNYRLDTSLAVDLGTSTSIGATTINDTNKTWTTEPDEHKGRVVQNLIDVGVAGTGVVSRDYVSSTAATALTLARFPAPAGAGVSRKTGLYYVWDETYRTYVVDLGAMKDFAPIELPNIDRFSIEVPLLRYVA